ncbi:MAG: hypothetical protein AAGF45_01845 [Pseudomonadota bacterium]
MSKRELPRDVCAECRWYVGDDTVGRCFLYPPEVLAFPEGPRTVRPEVGAGEFCPHFKPRSSRYDIKALVGE